MLVDSFNGQVAITSGIYGPYSWIARWGTLVEKPGEVL
jgi:hypothetical protein